MHTRFLFVLLITLALAVLGLSFRTHAQTTLPNCTVQECAFLPIIEHNEPPTPTATTTIIPSATPTTPTGTATPTLPPPTFNNCQTDPNPGSAPNYPVRITNIDKQAETVTLKNVTVSDSINLSSWTMCSVTGNQTHPIGGTLAPGQSVTFPNPGGPIWNNTSSDPGALYNPEGRLVSYWPD